MSKQTDLLNLTDAITVDGSNNVGIGTSSPEDKLSLDQPYVASGEMAISFNQSNFANRATKIIHKMDTSGNGGSLLFATNANGADATERMRIDSAGRVTMPYQPAFSAYASSGEQTIPVATWTLVELNNVRFDTNSNYNTSSFRFTAPVDGNYMFGYTVQFQGTSTEYLYSGLKVNGNFYHYGEGRRLITSGGSYWGNDNTLTTSQLIRLSANDYVELHCYNSSGGTILGGLTRRSFFGYLIG